LELQPNIVIIDPELPDVIQNNTVCNHYSFTDGQHRVCISKRIGVEVLAQITYQQVYCFICGEERQGKKPSMFLA
jgi:hypothetical protein